MEGLHLFLMLFLVVGFAAGAGAVWLVLQGRTNTAYARAKAEVQAGHAEVAERLRGKEEQVQTLQTTIEQNIAAMTALKAEVDGFAAKQLAAESEKATLAGKLEERDQRMAAMESELAAAKAGLMVQSERAAAPPPPPPSLSPAIDESVLRVLARPIEEHLAELRVQLEQLSATTRPEPALNEEVLRTLALPLEEQIGGVRRQLEQMTAGQATAASAASELRVRNAELTERLNRLTLGLFELRGALGRSLDLCNLAVAAAASAEPPPAAEAVPEAEAETVSA